MELPDIWYVGRGQPTLAKTSIGSWYIHAAQKLSKAEPRDKSSVILISIIKEWWLILRVWLFLSHMKHRENIFNFLFARCGIEWIFTFVGISLRFLNETQLSRDSKNSIHQVVYLFFSSCQVHESAGDERPRAVRPDEHHERGHAEQVPAGGMDQARVLPTLILLLSLRVRWSRTWNYQEDWLYFSLTHVLVIFLSAWSTPSSPLNWESWSMERNSQSRFKRRNISKIGCPILIKLVKLIQNTCPLSAQS